MTEEVSTERSNLVASISSQVAEGIGPLIGEMVSKKIKEESLGAPKKPPIPVLSHPGLNNQAILLSKWISEVEEIQETPTEDARKEKLNQLKKNLKRRLTTVVGADTDASIFNLADAYDKVEAAIDQTDDFGKAVAEHLKRSAATKATEAKKRKRTEQQPFRRSGFSEGTGGPAFSFQTFPQPSFTQFDAHQFSMPQFFPAPSLNRGPFYSAPTARAFSRAPNFPQRACFNCNQTGHIAAHCPIRKPQQ